MSEIKIKTFKITLQYDGSRYHGWQRQTSGASTIQGEIERALALITRAHVPVAGSGRTDARVHAMAQTASFQVATRLSPGDFFRALNGILPDDIVVTDCIEEAPDFHARFKARGKTYRYYILNRPLPDAFRYNYSWHIKKKLDVEKMICAAAYFIGEHDFKSFEGAGSPRPHTVRHVSRLTVTPEINDDIVVEITANGFLQYMVRNIVGTLVDIGLLRKTPGEVSEILVARDRRCAGPTAPPNGLFLKEVYYDKML